MCSTKAESMTSRSLTADFDDEFARPYFLWDEDRSVGEFRRALRGAGVEERCRLIGKLMREARDTDVWAFVSPAEVWQNRDRIFRYLGRRRAFWEYLLNAWHDDGALP
jgi:hypothetical protein